MVTNLTSSDLFLNEMISCGSSLDDTDGSSQTASEGELSKERLLKSRCKSEKKRRDKFNLFINDLQSTLSPGCTKRLDKLTVLRMAVNYLKMNNDFTVNNNDEGNAKRSFFLPCDELGQLTVEVLNGFLLAINEDAKFVYIADVVEKVLGVKASSLTEKTVHAVVHKDDVDKLTEEIITGILDVEPGVMGGSSYLDLLPDPDNESNLVSINFRILIDRKNGESEYEDLHCTGKWYSFKEMGDSYGNKVLVLLACLKTGSLREVSAEKEAVASFLSKHSLDGRFVYADTNCPCLTGYLPYELLGKSIYNFLHADDLAEFCVVHGQVTTSPSPEEPAALFIRFLSKGEEWLLFKAECQLVLKQINMHPNYISIKFTLATEATIRQFKKYAIAKAIDTESLLLDNHIATHKLNHDAANNRTDSDKEIESCNSKDDLQLIESSAPLSEHIDIALEENIENEICETFNDLEKDKDEETQLFKAEMHLHMQLAEKHNLLSKSFQKQKKQIEFIGTVIKEYAFFMEAPSFKVHYKQQVDMFEYFKYLLKKQQRQQEYLFKHLKVKNKQLEIQKRAIQVCHTAVEKQKSFNEVKEKGILEEMHPSSPHLHPNKLLHDNDANKRSMSFDLCNNAINSTERMVSAINCHPVNKNNANVYTISSLMDPLGTTQIDNSLGPKLATMDLPNLQVQGPQERKEWHKNSLQFNQDSSSSTPQLQNLLRSPVMQQLQLCNQQTKFSVSNQLSDMENNILFTMYQNSNKNRSNQINGGEIDNQSNETSNLSCVELQNVISNQILVHLQILQKNVLNQLQNAVKAREKSGTDFSQIFPVLQQLQQLQQCIIEQQTNQVETSQAASVNTLGTNSNTDSSNNVSRMGELMVQSLTNLDNKINTVNAIENKETSQCIDSNNILHSGSGSAFGDISATQHELENIKKVFSYEDQQPSDCFRNLTSSDIKSLMYPYENSFQSINDNETGGDVLKTTKELEEERNSTFQSLLIDQQQLVQLQQYQRMQITQQEQQISITESQLEKNLTQSTSSLTLVPPQEMVNVATSTTNNSTVPSGNLITSTSATPGSSCQEYIYSLPNFSEQSINDPSTWISSENEVLNMLLQNESDLFC